MQHFKVVQKSGGDVASAYPHDPEDVEASFQDFLEDMFSQGWEFVGPIADGHDRLVFKANAQ